MPVVVSSGALSSPLILGRFGVGNADVIKEAGVPLVANNAGVGRGYQDHPMLTYAYRISLNPDETLDTLAQDLVTPGALIKDGDHKLILVSFARPDFCFFRSVSDNVLLHGALLFPWVYTHHKSYLRRYRKFRDRAFRLPTGYQESLYTLKTAPKDKNGVEDGKFNVYGITGLEIVDLSVMPVKVSAKTKAVALAVGGKASSITIEELGNGF
ncbi:hypothetical protein S7711_08682 [Stachybotrys chartarum IBT 7711]|uniref:Glucose-methanol-choline oxidoreductase C-terminal domain-containing protein n=1 Tax=Stachybotrys chartarum (strain CBS 109288 / IBT 7711) TaxID=1280523 RepID=A0A084AF78_STACB|nr:hypothetical protein S7711_08682 [Stachybotrys chartarum IBT 7711]